MMFSSTSTLTVVFGIILLLLCFSNAKVNSNKDKSDLKKPSSFETNAFNFVRLFFMRMVYGFGNMFGLGDFLDEFAGGVFAPSEPDYGGLSYDDDDDYKESNNADYDYY